MGQFLVLKLMDTEVIWHGLHRKTWWIPLNCSPLYLQLPFWQAHGSFQHQVAPLSWSERYSSHLPLRLQCRQHMSKQGIIWDCRVDSCVSVCQSVSVPSTTLPWTMSGNGLSIAQLATLTQELTHIFLCIQSYNGASAALHLPQLTSTRFIGTRPSTN